MITDRMNLLEAWLREDDSAAAYFRAIQPAVPASLISQDNYARILEAASRVPSVCALGGFYFEFVLGEEEARADISFLAPAEGGCPGALAAGPLGGFGQRDCAWFTLQRLAAKWGLPGEPLHEKVAVFWLEFDINGTHPYSPSLFFTPAPAHQSRDRYSQNCRSLLIALAANLGEAVSLADISAALACLEHLPENGRLEQIGCMLSRRPAVLRLCLGLPGQAIMEYLREQGAPADLPQVAEVLDLLSAYGSEFILHLDLLGEVQPKVGLDLMIPFSKQLPDASEVKVLDELCRLKLCTPVKKDAVRKIIGSTAMGANLLNWPPALRRRCLQSNLGELSYFIRTLSHLKVVIEPGRDLVAKAYVGVSHNFKQT